MNVKTVDLACLEQTREDENLDVARGTTGILHFAPIPAIV
jgi:hypothetical protein